MKRQRRYTTEQQILDAIDQCKANAARLTHDSAALLTAGRRRESLKMDKRAVNIMEKKLPKLARTLAGFRTTPMPFIDQSIVEAK